MNFRNAIYSTFFLLFIAITSNAQESIKEYIPLDKFLYHQIDSMDKVFFDAYNSCNIEKQESIYSDSIEFFHDKVGLINSKSEIIQGTRNNICGKVTRYIIPGSIEVYPINNYGAVEIGFHRFYNNQEPDAESKPSKFIIIWKKEDVNWRITKVVSLH
ncbi:MAG TPA: nuclear transport factor 2 family protein [Flavobacteriales bacterium]|nr:nuclear transport factor 2 family protein [Flavobacteriales bacterium]HPH82297.1 nuclear transport factor 2 family protein [Flavobacteriales bacterium]